MKHEWGPSRLNHGNLQCLHCLCTDLEARYALGDECFVRKPAKPELRLVENKLEEKKRCLK